MPKYNTIQKVLIFLSIVTFVTFLYGLVTFLKAKDETSILGTSDTAFNVEMFAKKDFESPTVERFLTNEQLNLRDQSRIKIDGVTIILDESSEILINDKLNISKGYAFIETTKPQSITIHNEVIRIGKNSKVFYDPINETLIVYKGFIKFNDQIISENKMLRFEVDRFYVRDADWVKLITEKEFRSMTELLIDLDIFEEDTLI